MINTPHLPDFCGVLHSNLLDILDLTAEQIWAVSVFFHHPFNTFRVQLLLKEISYSFIGEDLHSKPLSDKLQALCALWDEHCTSIIFYDVMKDFLLAIIPLYPQVPAVMTQSYGPSCHYFETQRLMCYFQSDSLFTGSTMNQC